MEDEAVNKGVKTRLFGVVLVFLGILDSMLSWRGGFAASAGYGLLIAAGIGLYAIGSIRRARREAVDADRGEGSGDGDPQRRMT